MSPDFRRKSVAHGTGFRPAAIKGQSRVGLLKHTERRYARIALLAPLMASGFMLSGCMGSPTYGTDKTASEQLLDDVSHSLAFAPKRGPKIDYKPRPTLVKPAPGQKENLPQPQQSITEASNGEWPESPEQRLARLRADATAHSNDPNYRPDIIADDVQVDPGAQKYKPYEAHPQGLPTPSAAATARQRAEFNRRLAETKQGDPNTRKYLSEPPLEYRVAADSAPKDDIGEDEYKKERRLKREASKGKSSWSDWLPSW